MTLANLRVRIAQSRSRWRLARPEYIETGPGNLGFNKVFCKGCGDLIVDLIPSDNPSHRETKTIKGKIVVFERLVPAQMPAYVEVEITFDDGSFHITPLCTPCFRDFTDPDELEDIYMADMDQLLREGGSKDYMEGNPSTRIPVSSRIVEE